MTRPAASLKLSTLACLSLLLGSISFSSAAPGVLSPQTGAGLSLETLLPQKDGLAAPLLPPAPHAGESSLLHSSPLTPSHLPGDSSLLPPGGGGLSLGDGLLAKGAGTHLGEKKIELPSYHDTPLLDGLEEKKESKEATLIGLKELKVGGGGAGVSHDAALLTEHCQTLCSGVGGNGWLRGTRVCVCELKPDVYKENDSLFSSNKVKARELGLLMVHTLERRKSKFSRTRRCADIDGLRSHLNGIGRSHKGSGLGLAHKGLNFPRKEINFAAKQDEIKKLQTDFLHKLKHKKSGGRAAVNEIEPYEHIGSVPLAQSVPPTVGFSPIVGASPIEGVPLVQSVPA